MNAGFFGGSDNYHGLMLYPFSCITTIFSYRNGKKIKTEIKRRSKV